MITVFNNSFEAVPHDKIGPVDLIVADPPDNIGLKYDGFEDKVPDDVYQQKIVQWLLEMMSITRGPIFFTFNAKWTGEVEAAIKYLGTKVIQRLQWYYKFGQDQTRIGKYALCYRPVYWLNSGFVRPEAIKVPSARQLKYNDKRAAKGGKMPPNVWEFPRICGTFKERRSWLPTQLPEAMVERIVDGHCPTDGRVLDPFLGSGTTAIVCDRLGRDCVGIEMSQVTAERTAKHLGVAISDV